MNIKPLFDADGCLCDESLQAITDATGGTDQWLVCCGMVWDLRYGAVRKGCGDDGEYLVEFVTGGWSNNEAIIVAMEENIAMWMCCWYGTKRGGLYQFELKDPASWE